MLDVLFEAVVGVLIPLASWLPGLGGGTGGVDDESCGPGVKLAMVLEWGEVEVLAGGDDLEMKVQLWEKLEVGVGGVGVELPALSDVTWAQVQAIITNISPTLSQATWTYYDPIRI